MHKNGTWSGFLAAGRKVAFVGPFLVLGLVSVLLTSSSFAQNSGLDPLSQLQQQFQQRGNLPDQNANALQNMILQPAVPERRQAELPPSRLEQILSERAGAKLQQFGYDQLGSGRAVTVPLTGAVQDDYVLGQGDEIIVSMRGQENGEYRATVDRNGQVVLPRLAPLPAAGRNFGSFREDLDAAVHRAYVASNASVSVGRVRQISVLVSGEVNEPGQRLLTGLSSAVDALLLSGGVRKTGSLRNVRIQRGGHEYMVDLYSVLTDRGAAASVRLADGDRILVPRLGATVAVTGLVRQPGIYELAPHSSSMTVRALTALAGGPEVRGRYRTSVLRILPDGSSQMTSVEQGGVVRDSEILFIQLGADQTTSQATLSGGIGLAGTYPIVSGTKLSEVLKSPGALGASPYTPFGIIVRRDPTTLMPELVAFTPVAVLAGRENQQLQSNDVIRVLSANEFRVLSFALQTYVEGLANQQSIIRNPLGRKNSNQGQSSLANIVASQTGQTPEIFNIGAVPADVQRQQVNAVLDLAAPGSPLAAARGQEKRDADRAATSQAHEYSSLDAQQFRTPVPASGDLGASQPEAFPEIQQQSREQFQSSDTAAQQRPETDRTGDLQPPRNFTEQSVDSYRFATNREVQTFGQFARQLGVDPLILMNFLADTRMRLDGAVRGPGYYLVGPNASLDDVVAAAGGTVNWANESGVELISTVVDRQSGQAVTQRVTLPLHQGSLAGYIVRPGDRVRFSQVFAEVDAGSVTLQGEIRSPGTFPIIRGERLSELLARAGGLTNVAYPYGTVFLRQSAAQIEREGYVRAASEVQNELIVALTRVGNNKIDPAAFASLQTFVQELRNQQALGRISIVADPSELAAHPAEDPLLETGDVIYIPQRPSTISVLGQVLQPGSYPYRKGESVGDYIARAGGYSSTADEGQAFVVMPDGSAHRLERSWFSLESENLPPGSAVVIPRDVTALDLRQTIIDVSQIFSQFAIAIASVAVLSKQ